MTVTHSLSKQTGLEVESLCWELEVNVHTGGLVPLFSHLLSFQEEAVGDGGGGNK